MGCWCYQVNTRSFANLSFLGSSRWTTSWALDHKSGACHQPDIEARQVFLVRSRTRELTQGRWSNLNLNNAEHSRDILPITSTSLAAPYSTASAGCSCGQGCASRQSRHPSIGELEATGSCRLDARKVEVSGHTKPGKPGFRIRPLHPRIAFAREDESARPDC